MTGDTTDTALHRSPEAVQRTGTAGRADTPPVPAPARTLTFRQQLRRRRIWIWFAVVLAVGAAAVLAVRGFGGVGGQTLGASDATPAGAKALVEVLRGQGVAVSEARSRSAAAERADGATVLVYDELAVLDEDALQDLARAADRLVLVEPDFAALRALAPGVRHAGAASGPLEEASCEFPPAARAGDLSDGQRLLTIDQAAAAAGWSGCFEDDGAWALVIGETADGTPVTVVGARTVFANATVDEAGNAALALGLTGAGERLVWYLPGPADAPQGGPTLAELTPGWVSPLIVLGVLVTIAAGIWSGRRFGRLVVEDLPVEVPAGETRAGRARLYAASAARTHALDQLRMGTIGRLAAELRMPRNAPAREVADAAASVTGADPAAVRRLLLDALPTGDRELVELASAVQAFEDGVRAARAGDAAPSDASDPPTERRP